MEGKPDIPISMLDENLKKAIEATSIYFGVEYVEKMKEGSLDREIRINPSSWISSTCTTPL